MDGNTVNKDLEYNWCKKIDRKGEIDLDEEDGVKYGDFIILKKNSLKELDSENANL